MPYSGTCSVCMESRLVVTSVLTPANPPVIEEHFADVEGIPIYCAGSNKASREALREESNERYGE